jgi:hypothetical protein
MQFFLATYAKLLRRKFCLLLSSAPIIKAGSDDQAQSVYGELTKYCPDELAPHVEAYLMLAASGLLGECDRGAVQERLGAPGAAPIPQSKSAKCESRSAAHRRTRQIQQRLAERNVHPATTAAVILALRDRFSDSAVAEYLQISAEEARELTSRSICGPRLKKNTVT